MRTSRQFGAWGALALASTWMFAISPAAMAVTMTDSTPAADCPAPGPTLMVDAVPAGTDVIACGLIGSIVYSGDVGVEIPPPGMGMVAVFDTIAGTDPSLDVSVTPEGAIEYGAAEGAEDSTAVPETDDITGLVAGSDPVQNDPSTYTGSGGGTNPCKDKAYNLDNFKHYASMPWYFNSSTVPSELTATSSLENMRSAISNITGAHNDCDLADHIDTKGSSYEGTASATSSVDGNSCRNADAKSLVNFGDLGSKTLAATCSAYYTDVTPYRFYTADIKVNKGDFTWTTRGSAAGCSGLFDLQAVMTHEWGHAFGLAHVSETKHGSLTMSTQTTPCDNSARSLGLGDVRALEVRY